MSIEDGHEGQPGIAQLDPVSAIINIFLPFYFINKENMPFLTLFYVAVQLLFYHRHLQCMSNRSVIFNPGTGKKKTCIASSAGILLFIGIEYRLQQSFCVGFNQRCVESCLGLLCS